MATIEMYEDILDWCFNHTNILKAKDEENKRSLLHFAWMKGYAPIVTKLLTKGTKADLKDKHEDTSLHLASKEGHTKVAEILIQNGANVNIQGAEEMTPLHHAVDWSKVYHGLI